MVGQIIHVEGAFAHTVGNFAGLVMVDIEGGFFNQRYDVAHAQNAACNALGMKVLEAIKLFACPHQLDRFSRHGPHGKGCTAATIAINAGEHNAGDADFFVKGAGEINSVLSGECVNNQEGFFGLGNIAHGGSFSQEFFVNVQTTRRIQHHDVIGTFAGLRHGALGDLYRCLALDDGQRVDLHLTTQNFQLLLCSGAVGVEGGHQHFALFAVLQALGDFSGGCGFAGTLQAHHQNGDRRRGT